MLNPVQTNQILDTAYLIKTWPVTPKLSGQNICVEKQEMIWFIYEIVVITYNNIIS